MNSGEVVSTVHPLLVLIKDAVPLLAALATLTLYFYVRNRAGSSNFIRERFWTILGGAKDFSNEELKEQWGKVKDYERFRYKSGMRFSSNKKISETLAWLKNHDVGLEELLAVSKYFDCKKVDMKDPGIKNQQRVTLVVAGVFLLWSAFFSVLFYYPSALLTVKKTGTVFWISSESASAWNFHSWELTPESCQIDQSTIDLKDKLIICNLLNDENREKYIEKATRSQRGLGGTMIILGVLGMLIVFFSLLKSIDAHHLYKRTRVEPGA